MAATAEDLNETTLRDYRGRFKTLLTQNLNYFGNLEGVDLAPATKIVANVTYEQLTCVGYNPEKGVLEATIAIKRPDGYSGDLCHAGSTEYVRFFVDFGSGWKDAGLTAVKVHDVPHGRGLFRCPRQAVDVRRVARLFAQRTVLRRASRPSEDSGHPLVAVGATCR